VLSRQLLDGNVKTMEIIMTEHVKSEILDGIMTLTLQRPEKKNVLSGAMYDNRRN
jgi:enoyl-CoA hydratase/carnithine racemase